MDADNDAVACDSPRVQHGDSVVHSFPQWLPLLFTLVRQAGV
jgi:hypothetical protein